MKVLVCGGAGYIGSACTEYLLDNGHECVVFDSLVTGYRDAVDPRAKFIFGDLANRDQIFQVMHQERPEAIMHFAASSLVGESMVDPGKYFRNNIGNGLNLADAAVSAGVRIIVFSSTAATFGEPNEIPITENAQQLPINPYGESKLCFEKVLKWYHEVHGLQYAALRYFNAAGATSNFGEAHNPETHLIPIVLQVAAGQRKAITIFGDDYPTPDGSCVRDYIHILDLAQAHMKALYAPKSGHYNLGTGNGLSVKEIIASVEKVTGKKIPVEIAPRRAGDPPVLIACADRAKKELGWVPQFENVDKIIESAWAWKQKHPQGYSKK